MVGESITDELLCTRTQFIMLNVLVLTLEKVGIVTVFLTEVFSLNIFCMKAWEKKQKKNDKRSPPKDIFSEARIYFHLKYVA